jgi:hypothetical protein
MGTHAHASRGPNQGLLPGRRRVPGEEPAGGPDPERTSYSSFASFSDPDGNSWRLQEITERLPGR